MKRTKQTEKITLSSLLAIVAYLYVGINPLAAKTKRGSCGAPLPTSSRQISKYRYRILYPNTMFKLLKFYYKILGKNNSDYPIVKLFALPNVVAYHIANKSGRGLWKGLNLAYYPRRSRIQIFVICKKKR